MTATDATAELAFAGVAVQAELVRRGEVSSRELVELALDRIDTLDPELRAFVAVYPDRARAEADRADARRARGEEGALLGVPIAVKDEFDLEGEVTGRGTSAFNAPAAADAEVIRRLRDAGAVLVGKTTMPELGLWPFTESLACGVTRNPWDHERTPGGSSGGSAAAVAAGLVPAALGVDGAGSIRIPAACCGLFGLKPQRDRVPRTPHDRDGSHWICFGTLTRTVRDTALMLDVLADPDAGGAWEDAARTPPGPLRIGVAAMFPAGTRGRLSAEVAAAVQDTATLLSSLGHDVFEADTGFLVRDVPTTLGLLFRGVREFVAEVERPQRLERRTRALARPGALVGERPARPPPAGRASDGRARPRTLRAVRRPAHTGHVRARGPGAVDGGSRRDRDLPVGVELGAVHGALEPDRATGGVRTRRVHPGRPAARGAARRPSAQRADAAGALGSARRGAPLVDARRPPTAGV